MKKILTVIASTAIASSVFAQGNINWTSVAGSFIGVTNGTAYSSFISSVGSPSGGSSGNTALATGGVYYYALLTSTGLSSAPTSLSQFSGTLASAWLDTSLWATNGTTANGRIVQQPALTAAPAGNTTAGLSQNFIMVGWSANLGTTWAAALANLNNWGTAQGTVVGSAYFGVGGSVGTATLTTASPGTTILGSNAGQINDTTSGAGPLSMNLLYVTAVPEPSTMALAALGGASLLLFRRRK